VDERRLIERCLGLPVPMSQAQIAVVLGRDPGTVSREVRRNGGPRSARPGARATGRPRRYRAVRAQRLATARARRPKPAKLTGRLAAAVGRLLRRDWSPEQIAAVLPWLYPGEQAMRVSHETIYQALFVQGRGALRAALAAHLRSGRTARVPRGGGRSRVGRISGKVPISARPAEAADRAVPGHWEGDLLLGAVGQGAVLVLVERATRFVLLAPLPGVHTGLATREALTALIARLPRVLWRSLTWDQGNEMAQHAQFTMDTGIQVYFCDPHSPWQRGTNENTNGLLRQYWPKSADLRGLTPPHCDHIAELLNTRPRHTLAWHTPAQALNEALLATTP
jgi:IS30 family transposase